MQWYTVSGQPLETGAPKSVCRMNSQNPSSLINYRKSFVPICEVMSSVIALALCKQWSDYVTGILPGDWKWSDLDNETLRLIAALTQRAEQAETELAEYKKRTEARLIKMDEKLNSLLAA